MRPIKFRALARLKDGNLEWFYYTTQTAYAVWDVREQEGIHEWLVRDLQFTGLLDKNGKEIYEGDILEIPKTESKFVVNWFEYYWECQMIGRPKEHAGLSVGTPRFNTLLEVIGNIYLNPELLK